MPNLFRHPLGEFYITSEPKENHYTTLVFVGNPDFLKLASNWCYGSEVIKGGKFHKYDERSSYVRVKWENLKDAIAKTFEWEVIQEKDSLINYVKTIIENDEEFKIEIDWDEKAVELLSREKMEKFITERITVRNILKNLYFEVDSGSGEGHGFGSIDEGMES